MSSHRLVSAVFVLTPEYNFHNIQYMGRAAHKLALLLIGNVDAALATSLHEQDSYMPLTVSDLIPSDSQHHWMRVTAIGEPVVDVLEATVKQSQGVLVDGFRVVHALTSHHDWTAHSTVDKLIADHWRPIEKFTLNFQTATSIKSMDIHRPFPEPGLVFKVLYERCRKLLSPALPFQPESNEVEAFGQYLMALTHYDVQFINVPMKQGFIPAFQGKATYRILGENKALQKRTERQAHEGDLSWQQLYDLLTIHHRDFSSLIHWLAHAAFYTGVGVKTAQGMGMVRLET